MTDARLRSLARAAGDADDVESAARLLLERVRAGTLQRAGVALAAALGEPAARLVLGDEAPPGPPDEPRAGLDAAARARERRALRRWVEALAAADERVIAEATIAVASLALEAALAGPPDPHRGQAHATCEGTLAAARRAVEVRRALEAGEVADAAKGTLDPARVERAAAWETALERCLTAGDLAVGLRNRPSIRWDAAWARALVAVSLAASAAGAMVPASAADALVRALELLEPPRPDPLGRAACLAAIRAAVLPRLLSEAP